MNFNEYQEEAHKLAIYPKVGSIGFIYPVLGLSGETGEVSEKFKKLFRDKHGIMDKEFIDEIEKELGDVQWYLSEICSNLNLKLEDVAKKNIEKLQTRKKNNTLHGSGDNR